MAFIDYYRCNNCEFCLRETTGISRIEAVQIPYDGLFTTVRYCKNCNEEVDTYRLRTDFDELWDFLEKLKKQKFVTEKELNLNFIDVNYLQKIGILGPKRYRLLSFGNIYPLLLGDKTCKEDVLPKFDFPLDDSCPGCGKKDFLKSGDVCPQCKKGTLVHDTDSSVHFQ